MATPLTTDQAPSIIDSWRWIAAAMVLVALTVLSYLGWLGWHQHKHRVAGTTSYEGPYDARQVIGLAVTLAILAAVATWLGHPGEAFLMLPAALTVIFSVDASGSRVIGANLWEVGAAFLAVGAFAGAALVIATTTAVKRAIKRIVTPR